MSGIEKLQFDHVQILLYFRLRAEKKNFYEDFINIGKVHEKTLSRPVDIKIFRLGRRMYMYTLLPFTDAVLSEERQLIKWVGVFQVAKKKVGHRKATPDCNRLKS